MQLTLLSLYLLEKAMAPHSSTLAWKIPWTEEPGGLQSMRSLRVRRDWVTSLSLFTFMHWRRKWQPTPVFLPGESQGWRSLVGCRLWGCTVRHDWSDLAAAAAAVFISKALCAALGKADHAFFLKTIYIFPPFLQHYVLPVLSIPTWFYFSPTWAPLPLSPLKICWMQDWCSLRVTIFELIVSHCLCFHRFLIPLCPSFLTF